MERSLAAALVGVALLSALAAIAIGSWRGGRQRASADPGAAIDALADALGRGVAAQPLLDAFTSAGTIHSATLYAADGTPVAVSGKASPDVEQIFRSLPGGRSLSVEPAVPPASVTLRGQAATAAASGAAAAAIALIAAALLARVFRRRIDVLRTSVEEAVRDQTYATRLPPEAGALRHLAATINRMLDQMQQRDTVLRRRTTQLEAANKDLESFAATVSHDLRAPVGSIAGFAQALDEDYAPQLDDIGRECIHWIRHSAAQMHELIEGMLQMARLTRVEVHRTEVDISRIARDIAMGLQRAHPDRSVEFVVPDGIFANGDERLLRAVLENLIGNSFKFTSKRPGARIEIGARDEEGTATFYVRDNGAGFAPEHAAKMFRPFQRLHSEKEFSGTGIGLATVHRIVQRHGGRVWAEGEPEKGATVYFTTGSAEEWAA